jgi:hypothetical protein
MLFTQTQSPDFQLVLFPSAARETPEHTLVQPPLPTEMLQVFEQITGWVVGFGESKSSFQNRQLPSQTPSLVQGTFSIVDMSAQWPARKPTAHRAKCDQFVEHLDALVSELQATKAKLDQTQSLLEAHSPGSVEDDEAELFDCFVPRYVDQDWDREWDEDFEINGDLLNDTSTRAVDPPFEGWRMGGSPGVVSGRYVDWKLSDDEQIEMFVGQSSTPEAAMHRVAKLTVDPLTHEYVLTGDEEFDFFLYDQECGRLSLIVHSAGYRQLTSRNLVILTTSNKLRKFVGADQTLVLTGDVEDISQQLARLLEEEEQLLVLKRGSSQ